MKKWLFLLLFFRFCISVDQADQRRIFFQQQFDAQWDEFLLSDWGNSWPRYIPIGGHVWDFWHCVCRKIAYHRLFSTDVSTSEQWNDYIQRLKENEKRIDKLLWSLEKRSVVDCLITAGTASACIGLILSHKNDYNLHIFVFAYTFATILRITACGLIVWEKYRLLKNYKNKPRFKLIQFQELPFLNAEVEESFTAIV